MSETTMTAVRVALDSVVNPRTGQGLVASGMIEELTISDAGQPSFRLLLRRDDPATLVRQARQAITGVGLPQPQIQVTDPAGPPKATHGAPQSAQAQVPAPQPMAVPGVHRVIAVSSGKGGVGKSTVTVNMAVALAEAGFRVGVIDADFYGPDLPRMMGVYEKPMVQDGRIIPLEAYGVKLMSIGFLIDRDAPAIWRGPIITKVLHQFLHDVIWGELDYLLTDMPPGTGDAQLSLVQQVMVNGAVIVTTPQEVAVGDALRGAKMFDKVNVPVLGVVENMSGFIDPVTGMRHDLFGNGGGARLAEELGVPLLGQVPLQAGLVDAADRGEPITVAAPTSAAAVILREVADKVRAAVDADSTSLPTLE
ncbi:MAG TPA: Mrp/NBP35 family ATP-binding protein [Gemmatimonadales bacterium]